MVARGDEERPDEAQPQQAPTEDDSATGGDDLPDPDREGPTPDSERERLTEDPAPRRRPPDTEQ